MKKRLISLLVVLAVMLTANTYVFAAVSDDTPLNLLKELGILETADLEKSPDDLINRGDFTALLVKATAMSKDLVPSSGVQYFYDVNPDDKNAGFIEYAYKMGITNGIGDGLFGAKLNIKQGEALALCIRALKYDVIMSSPATLDAYMAFGTQMKLNGDISGGVEKELTYDDTYRILYRMMTTELLEVYETNDGDAIKRSEPSKSYLTSFFGIKSISGIVNSTPYAAKDSSEYTKPGYVEIGDAIFNAGTTNAESLFGYSVTAYYRETENENVLVWVDESRTNSIKLSTHDVVDYKPLVLTYIDGNKNREYKIAVDAVTVFNGSVVKVTSSFEFPVTGFVELFDDNNDKIYDIVKITGYDVVVAGGVNLAEKSILNAKNSRNHIMLEKAEHYSITDMEGNPIELAEISKGTLLHVEKNADEQYINIVVIDDVVNMTVGSINAIDERSRVMKVSNKDTGDVYYVSCIYNDISGNAKIASGGQYTFSLDIHGDIIMGEVAATTMKYGYLKAYTKGKTFESPRFRIFTDEGKFVNVDSAKKVKFYDGTSLSTKNSETIDDALDEVFNNSTYISLPCIVRYRLNSEGELSALELPGTVNDNNGFRKVGTASGTQNRAAARYTTASGTIGGYIVVENDTMFFNIPTDADDEKAYSISDMSEIPNNRYLYDSVGYTADASKPAAQAVVVPASRLNNTYEVMVYTGIGEEYNPETGDDYKIIYGYSEGKEKAYRISPNVDTLEVYAIKNVDTHEWNTGDVYVLFLDADGFVMRAATLFDIASEQVYKAYDDPITAQPSRIIANKEAGLADMSRVDCGLIVDISDGYMKMNNNGAYSLGENFKIADNTVVYLIDKNNLEPDGLTMGTLSDIVADGRTGIFTRCSYGATVEVIVVKNWGFVQGGDPDFEQGEPLQ